MIDKNFYLENLSAFDILIKDERKKAEEVIFRVYCILQRDKIWLTEVATDEEITEEDSELLTEVEEELKSFDNEYGFRFADFYNLIQEKFKQTQSISDGNLDKFPINFSEEADLEGNIEGEYEDEEDEENENEEAEFSDFSDEELDLVTDLILESAKNRFNYPEFLQTLPWIDISFVDNEIILPIIADKASGEMDTEIVAKILQSCEIADYHIDIQYLEKIIERKGKELAGEILAFKIAVDSLQQGAHPSDVVTQISRFLKK